MALTAVNQAPWGGTLGVGSNAGYDVPTWNTNTPQQETVHTGSWGLPDFGMTELVGKVLGAESTSQGGSNLTNASTPNNPSGGDGFDMKYYQGWPEQAARQDWIATGEAKANLPENNGGATRDLSVFTPQTYNNPYTGKPGTTTKENPNIPDPWTMYGDANPNSNFEKYQSQYGTPEGFMKEIDSEYNEKVSYLDKVEKAIREGNPEILAGILADLEAGKSRVGATQKAEQDTLETSGQEAGTRKENALDASRRLYNELRMGVGQKFGKLSNVGEVANVLLGREQQTNMSNTRQGYEQTMAKIDQEKLNVDRDATAKLEQMEADSLNMTNQANQEFRQSILDVDSNRLLALSDKTNQRLGFLSKLRDEVNAINQQKTQFRQQIEMMKQQQMLDLDTYARQTAMYGQSGQGAVDAFKQNAPTDPTSQYRATTNTGYNNNDISSAQGYMGNDEEENGLGQFGLGKNYFGAY